VDIREPENAQEAAAARAIHRKLLDGNNEGTWNRGHTGDDRLLVAVGCQGVIGYLYSEWRADGDVVCHELAVMESVQRSGIGTDLLRALASRCSTDITVWARPLPTSRAYFRRRGFHGPEMQGHLRASAVEIRLAITGQP
jgi:GNAT superfamily N-acetyltransferase